MGGNMAPWERSASGKPTVIEPVRGWRFVDVRELWEYRDLLAILARRDIKVRYTQTFLGVAWVVLRPLATMAIYTAVFGFLARIPSEGAPYAVFVFSALVPWSFFSAAVGASGNSLVGSAGLIGKVYFPRLIIPLASLCGVLVDLCVSTAFLLVLLPVFGVAWGPGLLAVPLLAVPVVLLALGVGTLFSALTVAYRDFAAVTGYILQVWMFATPVLYPSSLVPERWRWVLDLNPMSALIEGFRSAFLGRPFPAAGIAASTAVALALFAAGIFFFGRVERRFADII